MGNLKQDALDFIGRLQTLYFEQRDLNAILPEMSEDNSWVGTGAQEFCWNVDMAKKSLVLEGQEYADGFTITKSEWSASCLSETVCVVYGEITARPHNKELADVYNRVSAVCTRTDSGMKLSHLHMSSPDADQEDGRFYVKREDAQARETLRVRAEKIATELRGRNEELEALTENIPGGVHQCECDDAMTFISMSRSFLVLTGYSQEEIKSRFHNSFAEMISPKDLARVQAETKEQLSRGDTLEVEYRIERADGKRLWILEQGKRATRADGSKCFYCVLVDITRQREQREELRLMLERHRIIMDQTTDIIFEWNIGDDTLVFSANWRKKFGYAPIQETISDRIPLSKNIHADDMPAFVKIMANSAAGVPYSETEFRIMDALGNFRWYRIRATVQYDSYHHPIKAVGVIVDIDDDKKQRERLLEQTQRDPLTNLYNKTAVREITTRKIVEGDGKSAQALLIIDIDNFKGVNDTYGHLCGDTLLSDVAGVLKNHFGDESLVGRIGGDEFIVYLPSVEGEKDASDKVAGLLFELGKLRPMKDASPISCSIGATIFPQKGADYFELYQHADNALYKIKARGKNSFAFYDPVDSEGDIPWELVSSAVGTIDSEMESHTDEVGDKLAQYAFRMLYSSIDVNTAVEQLLEIIGRAYDVSRVYIFESSPDGRTCSNTFEWCNTGVSPEMDKLQNLDYEADLGDYILNFDENHIFYCKNINDLHPDLYGVLAPQGICSVLQCGIMDDGLFRGYVGFDECRENRAWTKPQIESLILTSNILSTFLLKHRLKEAGLGGKSVEVK